jgi:hypothetical protein
MSKQYLVLASIVFGLAGCEGEIPETGDLDPDNGGDVDDDSHGEIVDPSAATASEAIVAGASSTVCLNADGAGGKDTYALITNVLGGGAIENPDDDHHPPLRHIREATDSQVGPHFVFLAHRDIDTDRQTNFDRSRIEIKVAPSGGHDALKARKGQTFTYTWRFRIDPGMKFSNRFTHMFQLKSSEGDAGAPLLTITGRGGGAGKLQVIHTGPPSRGVLDDVSLAGLQGVWLQVLVRATFSDNGKLYMTISKPNGDKVITVDEQNIDMWRDGDHIRPKWGIYRGKSNQLRAAEDTVGFANFAITPGANPTSSCRTTP